MSTVNTISTDEQTPPRERGGAARSWVGYFTSIAIGWLQSPSPAFVTAR